MILFALACVLMLLAAMALLAAPLLKKSQGQTGSARVSVFVLTGLSIGLLSGAMYVANTNWSWQNTPAQAGESGVDAAEIDKAVAKTKASPDNLNAWMELGHVYMDIHSYALGADAYQHAYDLSKGQDVNAITDLAEALVLTDQTAVNGRASLLIEEALKLQPNQPKALWYGGLVALQTENLPLARDRFKALLALNPPPQVRSLLERQVQDIGQQLGETPSNSAPNAVANASQRKVVVQVKLSAELKQQLKQPVSLFVLARNPQQPGAPFAVQRHLSSELPLKVELTTADAMLPTRTLADAPAVEIVARLSASGTPTEQSGDYFGSASYSFDKQGEQGSVSIEINRRVP